MRHNKHLLRINLQVSKQQLVERLMPNNSNNYARSGPSASMYEAFWELTGFGFHRNSEVKRVARESNPMMGDPLGSSRVSSQKQNREGVVGAQSGQYRATVVE
ncbi:unnamed protein product [Malus baccata var. baccata]